MSSYYRTVKRVLSRPPSHWVGDGFHVYPVFADLAFTDALSPMLMFDYAAPKAFPPRGGDKSPLGVGQHPHRGFETVTIAFQGEVEHHDSHGGHGVIRSGGDVQWMTAGRGVIHQEFHSREFTERGGIFEMAQLWVNLPSQYKMVPPRYQDLMQENIPIVNLLAKNKVTEKEEEEVPGKGAHDDGQTAGVVDSVVVGARARVIAGELEGIRGVAKTYTPVNLFDIEFVPFDVEDEDDDDDEDVNDDKTKKKTTIEFAYPAHHQCIVFCRRGRVLVGNDTTILNPQEVALMTMDHRDHDNDDKKTNSNNSNKNNDDETVLAAKKKDGITTTTSMSFLKLTALERNSAVLIMGGAPLNEPIANRGPFVMNTQSELLQAMRDYQSGRMGR